MVNKTEKDFEAMVAERIVDTFYVPNATFDYNKETVCGFNGAIDCGEKGGKCRRCGWNPTNVGLRARRVDRALQIRALWLSGGEY